MKSAFEQTAREFDGRILVGGQRLRLSMKRLMNHWYESQGGKNLAAFRDRRRVALRIRKVNPDLVSAMNDAVLRHGWTCDEAYRRLGGKERLGLSRHTFERVIKGSVKLAARQVRAAREIRAQLQGAQQGEGTGGNSDIGGKPHGEEVAVKGR